MLKQLTRLNSGLATLAGCQTFCVRAGRISWRGLIFSPLFFLSVTQGAEVALSDTNLIPDKIPLWTESMLWDEQVSLSSGIGYNDNVLLSPFNPRGSTFVINGLDVMVLRVPLDGWQIVGSVVGDDTRFWHNVGADREDSFIGNIRIERDLATGWLAGLEMRGLYEDQVLDISTMEGVPATALVEGYGVTAQPSLRKNLFAGLWLKLEVPVTRWFFAAPLDNYWEFAPAVTAGYDFGQRADVTLGYSASYQPHDDWLTLDSSGGPPRDLSGNPLPPQKLAILQHQAELAWHQYWDADRHWRSATRLIFAYKEDNGGGWFNYYQYQAVEDLRWQTANWQIKGSAQLAYEYYPIQNIGILGPQRLYRTLMNFSLEMERRLFKGLKIFAKVEYQRAVSNETGDAGDYIGTTGSGGLRYEF